MRLSRAISTLLFFSSSSLFVCSVRAEDEASVTLESLLQAGKRNHPTLAKQPLLDKSRELSASRLNQAYYPHLSLGGRATWQSEVTSVDVPIPNVNIPTPPQDQYRATLDLKQTIWDGGVTSDQKRVVETRTQVEHEKVNVEWYQVRARILQLYFAGLVQQELEAQARRLYQHLGTVVDNARLALSSGILTERDVLLAQAQQLQASQAVASAQAELSSAKQSLARLALTQIAPSAVLAAPPATCAVQSSRPTRRPELDLLDAQNAVLTAQEEASEAPDRPRIDAFATGGYGRPGLNMLSNEFGFYFIGGVQLTVPLTYLYSGSRSNDREQLAVQRSLVERERQQVTQQIQLELEARTSDFHRLDTLIRIDDQIVDERERARKQTETQLALGTATMTDLINDLTQEDQARSQRAVHSAQRNLACHQLSLIRGEL